MGNNSEEILSLLDNLWMNFKNCRAHFPAISNTMIGQKIIPTAPYYIADGFQVSFVLSEPLDQSKIDKMHEIGHWILLSAHPKSDFWRFYDLEVIDIYGYFACGIRACGHLFATDF